MRTPVSKEMSNMILKLRPHPKNKNPTYHGFYLCYLMSDGLVEGHLEECFWLPKCNPPLLLFGRKKQKFVISVGYSYK